MNKNLMMAVLLMGISFVEAMADRYCDWAMRLKMEESAQMQKFRFDNTKYQNDVVLILNDDISIFYQVKKGESFPFFLPDNFELTKLSVYTSTYLDDIKKDPLATYTFSPSVTNSSPKGNYVLAFDSSKLTYSFAAAKIIQFKTSSMKNFKFSVKSSDISLQSSIVPLDGDNAVTVITFLDQSDILSIITYTNNDLQLKATYKCSQFDSTQKYTVDAKGGVKIRIKDSSGKEIEPQ